MGEAMVTGRMAPGKKRRGGLVLQREGLTASQAINRMYDKLIENGDASFLTGIVAAEDEAAWDNAVEFVDSLSEPAPGAARQAAEAPESGTKPATDPKPAPATSSRASSEPAEAEPAGSLDLEAIARAARFRGVI